MKHQSIGKKLLAFILALAVSVTGMAPTTVQAATQKPAEKPVKSKVYSLVKK